MFRQVGIGAAAVLSVGLLAAGCSEDGDTLFIGTLGELNNNDNFPANSVADNNLSADGGGLSPNEGDATDFSITFNCDWKDSDGTFAGDNSAIVLFQVQDGSNWRVFGTRYASGVLSPPVELLGEDRDYTQPVTLSAFTNIPLNVGGYVGSSSANTSAVTANNGNWLILGEYVTFFRDPVLAGAGGNLTTSNARGPRNVLASWVFASSLANSPVARSAVVGGVDQEFRYGFQETGTIVNTALPGGGAFATNVPSSTQAAALAVPPNHVTSFGAVTDGYAGQATFGGSALPFSANTGSSGGGNLSAPSGDLSSPGHTAFNIAIPHVSTAGGTDMANNAANLQPRSTANYRVGEAVSYVRAFWTQICNSFSGGGTFTEPQGGFAGGHELQLRSRGFNLATLSWENDEAEVVPPAERNSNSSALRAGTAPFPTFWTYNGNLFFKYADASLATNDSANLTDENLLALTDNNTNDWFQEDTGGHRGGSLVNSGNTGSFWEEIIAHARVANDGDGTNSFSTLASTNGTTQDVSSTSLTNGGSAGTHTLSNPSVVVSGIDSYPADREISNFNMGQQSIFGPDEGLTDITLFYAIADNSNTASNANIDREGWAVGLDASTGAFVTGTNPIKWSGTHAEDWHGARWGTQGSDGTVGRNTATSLEDPIVANGGANGFGGDDRNVSQGFPFPSFFGAQINRTGEYVALAFLRDVGLSAPSTNTGSFRQALHVNAYQTVRGTSTATVAFDARFAGVQTVSGTGGITQSTYSPGGRLEAEFSGDAEYRNNWDGLPVNGYAWQGGLGYRCPQSDHNTLSLFYEQSDTTEDRVYGRQMSIVPGTSGTPALTLAGTAAAELDASASVPGHSSFNGDDVSNGVQGRSTFAFLDGDGAGDNFWTGDASDVNEDGTAGDVAVFYCKVIDNTNTDGDNSESSLRASVFSQGGTATGFSSSMNIDNADNATGYNATSTSADGGVDENENEDSANAGNADTIKADGGRGIEEIVSIGGSTDIVANPDSGVTSIRVYVTDRVGDRQVDEASGGITLTANNSSQRGLFTRTLNTSVTSAATAFDARFTPRILPGTAAGALATRLDHLSGNAADIAGVLGVGTSGMSSLIVWEQRGHLWAQATSDGVTYLEDNGSPNPYLVDHDSSAGVGGPMGIRFCEDADGNDAAGLVWFTKEDRDGDDRLLVRGAVTVQ